MRQRSTISIGKPAARRPIRRSRMVGALLAIVLASTMAPMTPAWVAGKVRTTVTLAAAPVRVVPGAATVLSGQLTDARGRHLGGMTIRLWARDVPGRSWARIGIARTNADGQYRFRVSPLNRTKDVQARFGGSSVWRPDHSPVRRATVAMHLFGQSITAKAEAMHVGVIHFSGVTNPGARGMTAHAQVRGIKDSPAGTPTTWTTVKSVTIPASGHFATAWEDAGCFQARWKLSSGSRWIAGTTGPQVGPLPLGTYCLP